ncbi:MAG: nucleotidyltransferase domain-containing protein [Microgenomates group bacterium]
MGQKDILLKIAHLLNQAKIPYLLTGSLAVAYYGYPRGTHDIDFVIEVETKDLEKILGVVKKLGKKYIFDKNQIKEAIENSSQFNIYHPESGVKIDFWVSSRSDFEISKLRRRKEIFIEKQKVFLISAEDLILTKLLWCQRLPSERHFSDCKGVWEIQQKKLDKNYLNFWIDKLDLKDVFEEIKEGV